MSDYNKPEDYLGKPLNVGDIVKFVWGKDNNTTITGVIDKIDGIKGKDGTYVYGVEVSEVAPTESGGYEKINEREHYGLAANRVVKVQ